MQIFFFISIANVKSFVELSLHKIFLHQILAENPLKSVIEISKFLSDLSPSHQVTIGLKRLYVS